MWLVCDCLTWGEASQARKVQEITNFNGGLQLAGHQQSDLVALPLSWGERHAWICATFVQLLRTG